MATIFVRKGLFEDYLGRTDPTQVLMLFGTVAADKVYLLDAVGATRKELEFPSAELFEKDKTRKMQVYVEDILNNRASVMLGGIVALGLIVNVDETKEAALSEAVLRVREIFKSNLEMSVSNIYILNAKTHKAYQYAIEQMNLNSIKFTEFKPSDKLIRTGLKLNTSFLIKTDYSSSEWEDQCIKLLIASLKSRNYLSPQGKVVTAKTEAKFDAGYAEFAEFKLINTPWDSNTITDTDAPEEKLSDKLLQVNVYLESFQQRDCYFETILNNLMSDLEKTMIDRIFTNLDHGYIHLPKRIIVRPDNHYIGFPAYVIPGQDKEVSLRGSGFESVRTYSANEGVYGLRSPTSKETTQKFNLSSLKTETNPVKPVEQEPCAGDPVPPVVSQIPIEGDPLFRQKVIIFMGVCIVFYIITWRVLFSN